MFEVSISSTSILKDSVSTIAELIDEGVFKANKNGITFIASDRAMVAVVDFKLGASAFDEYKIDADISLAVNMLNFVSILRRANASDKITLRKEDAKNKLEIILKGASVRRFELPLLDITESEIPPIDQLDFTCSAELRSEILEQGVADAEVISDLVVFDLEPDVFKMKSEGDSSVAELKLERGEASLIKLDVKERTKSGYPLDYLKKMVKAAKLSQTATIKLGKDFPMRLDFKFADKMSLGFVLAPRISDE